MPNKKILPMKYPVITCYPTTANLLSMLSCHQETIPWIYSNFINVAGYFYEDTPEIWLIPGGNAAMLCPFITHSVLSRQMISQLCKSIVEFALKSIKENYYLYLVLDQSVFLLDCFSDYMPHDIFVYGFDIAEAVFYVADFTFNNKYSFAKIGFEDFEKAYWNVKDNDDGFLCEGRGGVSLWRYFSKAEYRFDIIHVKDSLVEYLYSENYINKFRTNRNIIETDTCGLNIYNFILSNLQLTNINMFIRRLHNLYDHKVLMIQRLIFMNDNNYLADGLGIISAYTYIKNQMSLIICLAMKYSLKKSNEIYERMKDKITELIVSEKKVVELIIENIIYNNKIK